MSCRLIVMGVSGSGKTTLGRALAQRLHSAFIDADDLHPPANVAKMARSEALTDADRAPWLDRVAAELAAALATDRTLVIACSALRRIYRDRLREADAGLRFVYLNVPRAVLEMRLGARAAHFMPASLLDSQLATLEPPALDENAIVFGAQESLEDMVAAAVAAIEG